MKKTSSILLFLLSCIALFAQPQIKFENETYNFGDIKEDGGKVTGRFIFTNVGNSDLELTMVRPSCGCTTASYTKEPVKPGQQGFIEVTFDPYNRTGVLNKTIRIKTNEPKYDNAKAMPMMLYIKGYVQKKEPSIYEKTGYKNGNGNLRMKKAVFQFKLKNTAFYIDTIKLRNFNERPVKIEKIDLPAHISEVERSFQNGQIEANADAYWVLKYDAAQKNAWGNVSDYIVIYSDDTIEPKKVVQFTADISEDFSYLQNNSKIPNLSVEEPVFDFGKVSAGTQIEHTFVLTNKGNAELIIRQMATNYTTAIHYEMKNQTLKPGKSTKLKVTFDTDKRRGKQYGTITLICNDPAHSNTILRINGEIVP